MNTREQAPDTWDVSFDRDPLFHYVRVHLPTKTRTKAQVRFMSRALFLENLARWNRQGLNFHTGPLWAYYEAYPTS